MKCVSTASYSIRFNGITMESCIPSKGLRQGYPTSPLLFNLCIQFLSEVINLEASRGSWKALKFNNQDPHISHMAFADDIVIFGEATLSNIQFMINLVEYFCHFSGQRINFLKSQVICPANLSPEVTHYLFEIKGFSSANPEDIKYLGFPYLKNGRTTQFLSKVVLDIQNKIEHWKLKPLSQAERLIMTKSVLLAMPVYLMSCYKFPKKLTTKLQHHIACFWKNKSPEQRSITWDSLCRPKRKEGWG